MDECFLSSPALQSNSWLEDNGMQALELLCRAVSFRLSVQSSRTDHKRSYPDASIGVACGLSGVPADWALCMLEPDGRIAAWLTGAELLYACNSSDVIGQRFPLFGLNKETYTVGMMRS